jgi:nicotinamide riboside kinase
MSETTVKVAFIGTHGTGKTTALLGLATYLKTQNINIGFLQEVARTFKFPVNHESTPQDQRNILLTQIIEEDKLEIPSNQVLLCDRAAVCNYMYYVESVKRSERPDPYPSLRSLVVEHASSYDLLVFVTPDLELQDDKFRDLNRDFQMRIHEGVAKFLDHLWIQKLHIVSASELRMADKQLEIAEMVISTVRVSL